MAGHDDAFYDEAEDFGGDAPEGSWDELMREQMAATPWWAVSLSLHLFVVLVILPLVQCATPVPIPPIQIRADIATTLDEPLPEPEQPLPDSKVKNPDQPKVPDPVDSDLPSAEHNESADNEDHNQSKGFESATSDVDMSERFNNDAIGPGANAGGRFGNRLGGRRNQAMNGGGDPGTESAVDLGLKWLADHQDKDGKWDGDGFMKHDPPNDVCTGAARLGWVDPGLTGLATLAFLGAGHTHRYGVYRETVKRAVQYLIKIQSADGLIGGKRGHYMYNHSICALALAEAYGMTNSPLVKNSALKAIEYLVQARNPGMAWRYGERDGANDISVTGWCVMALKSAKAAELDVPGLDEAFKQSEVWIESVTDPDYGISGYQTPPLRGSQSPTSSRFRNDEINVDTLISHAPNHTPTAIATMCRVFFGYARDDARLNNGANAVAQMPPVWDVGGGGKLSKVDYYYWYYGTLAMFQVGGEHWKTWNRSMKKAIVEHQLKEGSARGSWDPLDAWGFGGGRVYATATNVLSLEIYYRYSKVFR